MPAIRTVGEDGDIVWTITAIPAIPNNCLAKLNDSSDGIFVALEVCVAIVNNRHIVYAQGKCTA